MGAAEDAHRRREEARRQKQEKQNLEKQAYAKEARKEVPGLVKSALENLERYDYPDMAPGHTPAKILKFEGEERVAWELMCPLSKNDWNPEGRPGIYLLGGGEIVCRSDTYTDWCSRVPTEELDKYIDEITSGLRKIIYHYPR